MHEKETEFVNANHVYPTDPLGGVQDVQLRTAADSAASEPVPANVTIANIAAPAMKIAALRFEPFMISLLEIAKSIRDTR